jgi:hypothetical protein
MRQCAHRSGVQVTSHVEPLNLLDDFEGRG